MSTNNNNEQLLEWQQTTIAKLKEVYPEIQVEYTTPFGVVFTFYLVRYYNDEIEFTKCTKLIKMSEKDLDLDTLKQLHLTKQQARDAITKYLPEASEKFQRVLSAFKALQESEQVRIDYTIGESAYGTFPDDDFLYITFMLGGYSFTFNANNY